MAHQTGTTDTAEGSGEGTGLSRRRFLQVATSTAAVAALGGGELWRGASAQGVAPAAAPVKVTDISQLEVGKPVSFSGPDGYAAVLVKLGASAEGGVGPDKDVVAFSRVCTHMGCAVAYDTSTHTFNCPCHQSHYDASKGGFVVQGPSPRAVPQIQLQMRGTEIWAVGIGEPPYGAPISIDQISKIYGIAETPASH